MELQDLQNGYNELCETFPEYRISMVHGQMKAKDKDEQMQRFVNGETQIIAGDLVVVFCKSHVIRNLERFFK